MQFELGAMLESFRSDTLHAVKTAAELGLNGLQITCSHGDYTPETMTPQKIAELRQLLSDYGLRLSAVCGDLGTGYGNPEKNPALIERSKRIMELAKNLGTDIVTTHIGVIPNSPDHDRYKIMQEACFALSRYADGLNAHFAIETGPEPAPVLKGFLDTLGSNGVAVNLDPANLAMVLGDDPVAAVDTLKDYIVHTHAKDGIMLRPAVPEYVYGITHPIPQEYASERHFDEVPLGTGSVDFPSYLKALDKIGYHGFLTIEREVGEHPLEDIKTAVSFLRETIASA